MTTVQLMNLALAKLGVTKGITATSESTLNATLGSLHFDHMLRATLRLFPWPFATKYAEPVNNPFRLVSGPAWNFEASDEELEDIQAHDTTATYVVGDVVRSAAVNYVCILAHDTNQAPPNATYWSTSEDDLIERANPDFLYAYRWPTDCLFVRRIVPPGDYGAGHPHTPAPPKWRLSRDANGLTIVTNEREAQLEYTAIDCTNLPADDLFIDAFTWRLAAALAPGIARNGLTVKDCYALYIETLKIASATALNESNELPNDAGDDYIRARG